MYPASEVRRARRLAVDAGEQPPPWDDTTTILWLERHHYLPQDHERVARIVAEATAAAIRASGELERERRTERERKRKRRPHLRVA